MGVLSEVPPDKHILTIRRATDAIVKQARKIAPGRTWSICELLLDEDDLEWLRSWAASLHEEQVRVNLRYHGRPAGLGLLLLTLASEWCRRYGHERGIYGVFNEFEWDELARKRLFTPTGYPQISVRESIEEACKTYGLRHAFDSQTNQPWYLTIKLQFGFTLLGAKDQLNHWLAGVSTEAIDLLLSNESTSKAKGTVVRSDSFADLWKTLRDFRTGAVRRPTAMRVIAESPWTLAAWGDELLDAALRPVGNSVTVASSASPTSDERTRPAEDLDQDPEVLTTPRIVWRDNQVTWVANYDSKFLSMLAEDCYFISLDDEGFDVLRKQPDGSYSSLSRELQVSLPTDRRQVLISVSDGGGRGVTSQLLELFKHEDDFQAFGTNGKSVSVGQMATERGYTLRLPIGSKFEPDEDLEARFLLNESWWVQLRPGWSQTATVQLPGDPVAMPVLQEKDELVASWTESVSSSVELLAGGTQFRVRLQVRDSDVEVLSLRVDGNEGPIYSQQVGLIVSGLISVSSLGYEGSTRIRILAKRQNTRVINRVIRIEREGLVVLRKGRWQTHQAENAIDATRMSRTQSVVIPGTTNRGEGWTLIEGSRRIALSPCKSQRMTDLGCRGWPLRVTDHEFNRVDSSSLRVLAANVIDRGIVQDAAQLPGSRCVRIELSDRIDPGNDHHCVLWTESGRLINFGADDIRCDQLSWVVDPASVGVDYEDLVVAAAVAYRGVRLGSWWTDDWWRPITTVDSSEAAAMVASCLRWFYLPLRQRSKCVDELVSDFGAAVFDQWCQFQPSSQVGPTASLNEHRETDPVFAFDLLRQNEDEPGWSATVRSFLSIWQPTPDEANQIAPDIMETESVHSLESLVMGLSTTMPFFVGNFVSAWMEAQAIKSNEDQLRSYLCSQLCDPLKKRAEDFCDQYPIEGSHPLVPWLPFDEAYVETLISYASQPTYSGCGAGNFEASHNQSELCRLIAAQLVHPAKNARCQQTVHAPCNRDK
ncbi:hypothetical protein Poly51_36320 [Rubripirellula tenax]|uniref:Uncharacterized protein n=1 Tax=Rubripirellula tenax TaxID=2528015 RepID=A0A5C6F336_9BACT|nr:hypothetical protein [Rubripirellula tenax]TWU54910.1 hypothetical protein Poly51_36320 [Rubripirellula tenax]